MVKTEYVLGTAQFGMDYGIANLEGKPDFNKAAAIVHAAWTSGARSFDTAQGYSVSEEVLGLALRSIGITEQAKVYSKLDPTRNPQDKQWLASTVFESLQRLGIKRLAGLFLHRYEWLEFWDKGLGSTLVDYVAKGLVLKIGVSVYTLEQLENALKISQFDIFQISSNLWSSEIFFEGYLDDIRNKGKEVFLRSVFLQGLLLMEPQEVKERLPFAFEASCCWQGICAEFGVSAWQMCMRYAATLGCPVVVGADNPSQALENSYLLECEKLEIDEIKSIYHQMKPVLSEQIVNPALWSK